MKIYYSILFPVIVAAMTLIMPSCSDDFNIPTSVEIIEGEPAHISLSTNVGDMMAHTRADMPNGRDKEINSIWLGFFKQDGTLAYKFTYESQGTLSTADKDFSTLNNIEITSGRYFVAAVANINGNRGVLYRSDGTGVTTPTYLSELLDRKDLTYEDFCNIAFLRGAVDASSGPIDTPTGNLPMHGVYLPESSESHPISSDRVDELANTDVYIAPSYTETKLPGRLHFRRLVSHNTFNVSYNQTIIKDFEIVNARVFNVPLVSWVAERSDNHMSTDGKMNDTNAGDYVGILGKSASTNPNRAAAQVNYPSSGNIQSADIVFNSESNSYSFDWWQLENRRQGLATTNTYSKRENERKASDGRNTGIYTSLTGESGEITANNCATYVQISVRMEMANTPDNQLTDNSQMTIVDAVYTIHLGYCNGEAVEDKAKDFNCNRNTKYTYNVSVEGVDKIILEAQKEDGEYEHGAEGTVTFVTTQYFEADAHYCAYNVSLSNKERASAEWQIRVYTDADTFVDINSQNYNEYEEKYYNWIELRPTSAEDVIAPYKPIGGVETATATNPKTFTLADLSNLKDYPAYGLIDTEDDTPRWYTVFLNEYIYEDTYNGNTSADWAQYVNLPPRTFWLKVEENRSTDQESIIIDSKYTFRQKSIQTFYSTTNPVSGVIMGMEHTNELSGVPLMMHGEGMQSDGRHYWNGYQYVWGSGTTRGDTPDGADASQRNYNYFANANGYSTTNYPINENNKLSWNTYIPKLSSGAAPMTDKNNEYNGVVDVRNLGSFTAYYSSPSYNDNNQHYYAESRSVAEACLNRNRDLNGDGTIDQNEIRWIVPDVNQYVRLVMGSSSFSSPLIIFSELKDLSNSSYYEKSLYHFGSIDSNQLWSEEGVSTAWVDRNGCSNPQEVRCIRYLGNDYSKFPAQSDFSIAAKKDGENQLLFSYGSESTRSAATDEIPWHKVSGAGNYNRPATRLEFKSTEEEFALNEIMLDDYNDYSSSYKYDNAGWFSYLEAYNPCDKFNTNGVTGWRVPNQVEIMSLFNEEELGGGNYLTCTQEYFGNRVLGADGTHGLAFNVSEGCIIKCVRDIE